MVGIDVPDPVHALGQQFRHFGCGIGHKAHIQRFDGGLAFGACRPIAVIAFKGHFLAGFPFADAIGAGANRGFGIAVCPDLFTIGFGIDRHHQREIFQGGGIGFFQGNTHAEITGLFGLLNPVGIGGHSHLAVGGGDKIDGIDHIIGAERAAVMEGHTRTQLKINGLVIDQRPGCGQQRLQGKGVGITIDQHIPCLMRHHHAGAQIVVIGVDIGDGIAHGDAQCICGFLCQRTGHSRAEKGCAKQETAECLSDHGRSLSGGREGRLWVFKSDGIPKQHGRWVCEGVVFGSRIAAGL